MAECPVCLEEYSAEAHQPKFLPCGHTACLPCLRQVPSCPECRQPYRGAAQDLPTNYALLHVGGRVAEEWWCSECGAPAEEGCRREHLVMQAQAALRRQALQLAPAAAEAAQGLGEAVRAAAAEPARAALQLLAEHQADAAADCRLSLRRGDAAFNAQCTLADAGAVGALARALVCALAAEGRLLRDEPQQEQPVVQQDGQQQQVQQEQPPQQELPQHQPPQQEPQQPAAEEPPAAAQPFPVAVVIQELDVGVISRSRPLERQAEKDQLLQRVRRNGVINLLSLDCSTDPAWSLDLLQAAIAAGRLKTLVLYRVREEHLRAAHEAPGLQSLYVFATALVHNQRLQLPALAQPSDLRVLSVSGLSARTVASLLRAHQHSLSHLALYGYDALPHAGEDAAVRGRALGNSLAGVGLARLRMVLLHDPAPGHDALHCRRQMEGLRDALPALRAVLCRECDPDAVRQFGQNATIAIRIH